MKTEGKWVFVIDTDSYAGNFERDMTAYCTGIIGDCEVGKDFADLYVKETGDKDFEKFGDSLEQRPDEHGCHRPTYIYPTPGYFNHGMGGEFQIGQEKEALKDYKKICEREYKEELKTLNHIEEELKAGRPYSDWTLKAVDRERKQKLTIFNKESKLKKVNKYPAYLSVGIFFFEKPSAEQIDIIKKRAMKFQAAKRKHGQEWDKSFSLNILGFRLIEEISKNKEYSV